MFLVNCFSGIAFPMTYMMMDWIGSISVDLTKRTLQISHEFNGMLYIVANQIGVKQSWMISVISKVLKIVFFQVTFLLKKKWKYWEVS